MKRRNLIPGSDKPRERDVWRDWHLLTRGQISALLPQAGEYMGLLTARRQNGQEKKILPIGVSEET